ncbi:MAG: CAP domain-containing protein [Cyanobacteria bacterium]|nr:CAP domain-containing protein [Cyanobacteriota bacterium]MDW8200050.1 CAP domain-containing protein [Cyanobacteriota bacterium SKYGB_h_bin112]
MARQHSQDMATKRVPFGHTGLQQRLYSVDQIIPTRRVAENAAYIFSHSHTADRAFRGWLRSHAHRQAIEASYYRYTGIGVAQDRNGGFYFTQLYVLPR